MKIISAIAALAGIALLAVAIGYCFQNDSGHGSDPRVASLMFLPVLLIGALAWRHEHNKPFSRLAVLVGVVGLPFGFFAHHTGILMDYELWIQAGMPEPSPSRVWLLSSYAVVAIAVLLLGFKGAMPNQRLHRTG